MKISYLTDTERYRGTLSFVPTVGTDHRNVKGRCQMAHMSGVIDGYVATDRRMVTTFSLADFLSRLFRRSDGSADPWAMTQRLYAYKDHRFLNSSRYGMLP